METNPIIVTGATGSIGSAVTRKLARQGKHLIMACRNTAKAEQIRNEILGTQDTQIDIFPLDLADIHSISNFVNTIVGRGMHPCGLLNNAAVMCRRFERTADGFEKSIGVNYIGTYLLTRLIDRQMADNAVIVNTVSITRLIYRIDKSFFDVDEKTFGQLKTYSQSKVALLHFTDYFSGISAHKIVATDPGVVNSNMISMERWFDPLADILFRPLCKSPEKGALPAVNALYSTQSKRLFFRNKNKNLPQRHINKLFSEWLWNATEDILRKKGIVF